MWEEGRWSGSRVTRFSVFACAVLVAISLVVSGRLGPVFDIGFVLLCIAIALAIRPTEFFNVGIMPPILVLAVCFVLSIVHRGSIAPADDGFVQAIISGLAHRSGALMAGYALALAILAIRTRVVRRSAAEDYSNLEASPAPYRVTSAAPEVKSTTVVEDEPHSPESITASTS